MLNVHRKFLRMTNPLATVIKPGVRVERCYITFYTIKLSASIESIEDVGAEHFSKLEHRGTSLRNYAGTSIAKSVGQYSRRCAIYGTVAWTCKRVGAESNFLLGCGSSQSSELVCRSTRNRIGPAFFGGPGEHLWRYSGCVDAW